MTEPTFANAAPVFEIDGEASPTLGRDTVEMVVTEDIDGLRALTVKLHAGAPDPRRPNDALRHLDRRRLDFGKLLRVYLGPDATQALVFEGRVSSLEALLDDGCPPYVIVRAEDELMKLRMTRRVATYRNVTDADLAQSIADEHALDTDIAADGPRYDVVQQWNQSDLAFLRSRARASNAELWCTGNVLHFASREKRHASEVRLVFGNHLLHLRVAADLAHQRSSVNVTGYDASSERPIDERIGDEVVAAETPTGITGSTLVASQLQTSATLRVRDTALNVDEARSFARAEMLRRARRFVTVRGLTTGSQTMTVGSRVELQRVGPIFEGTDYYVTRVSHTFDLTSGFRTHFEAERTHINEVA